MLDDMRAVFMPYCLDQQPDGRYAILIQQVASLSKMPPGECFMPSE